MHVKALPLRLDLKIKSKYLLLLQNKTKILQLINKECVVMRICFLLRMCKIGRGLDKVE